MNLSKLRNSMVENQLRPNKINEPRIYSIFNDIEKERFFNTDVQSLVYCDLDINLIENRGYLKNLHIAQLVLYSKLKKKDKVLHIGGLTGYVTTILSKLSKNVIVIENEETLVHQLKENIKKFQLSNVEIINCDFQLGYKKESPYDVIFIDCPLTNLPSDILKQLSSNMGRLMMIEKINDDLGKGIRITNNRQKYNNEILFDVSSKFNLYKEKESFVF